MNFDESIQLMRGEVGTEVVFTIIRSDDISKNITSNVTNFPINETNQ